MMCGTTTSQIWACRIAERPESQMEGDSEMRTNRYPTESITMRQNILTAILAGVLALTTLLAACGSDDPGESGDSGGDAPTTSSREAGNPTPTSGATPTPGAAATPTPVDHTSAATDREALVALYEATDRFGWDDDDNWLSDAPLSEWYGVTINARGRVVSLFLFQNRLSGEIPAELGNLTNLQSLELSFNDLSGEIPPELGNLANLEVLNLHGSFGSQLSGEIPAELGNLLNLRVLDLSNNQLSGEIPAELGNLSNLETLGLSQNQLSGEIPAELGSLSSLERLFLYENQLSGEMPAELGNLSNLEELFLHFNQLSGEVPAELGNLSNLWGLYLHGNQLSGCVPAALEEQLLDTVNPDLGGLPFC